MENKTEATLMNFIAFANNKVSDKYLKSLAEQQAARANKEKLLSNKVRELELLLNTLKNRQLFLEATVSAKETELTNALLKIEQLQRQLLAKNAIIDREQKKTTPPSHAQKND